ALLVPNDLLVMNKSDAQQTVENLPRELRCVPNIGDLKARDELERFGPVGAGVGRDRSIVVALSPLLHIARLRRPAAAESGTVAPLRIKLDAVRRIGHHQSGLAVAEKTGHGVSACTVCAKDSMRATQPEIAWPRYWNFGGRRDVVAIVIRIGSEESVELTG